MTEQIKSDRSEGLGQILFVNALENWREGLGEVLKELHQCKLRARNEKTEMRAEVKSFLLSLLEALDDFDDMAKAIDNALVSEDKKARRVLKNLSSMRRQIGQALIMFSVEKMDAPSGEMVAGLHKAVEVDEESDLPPGHIVRILKDGYYWKNSVLRPVEVVATPKN